MIVRMQKACVVSRAADRDRLLEALRDLGVLHLTPVDPTQAVAEETTLAALDRLGRAAQMLADIEPAGDVPDISALDAAAETVEIQRQAAELNSRLGILHRQIEQLAAWGDVTLAQFEALRRAGIDVQFYALAPEAVSGVRAECIVSVGREAGETLIAVIDRAGEATVPEDAEPVALPPRDRPSLRAEAKEIDRTLSEQSRRLGELAHLCSAMRAERGKVQEQVDFTVAQRGGLNEGALFAVQGWVPATKADTLGGDLTAAGLDAAVQLTEPAEDEEPPTLVRYPRWASPIQALFDILGTTPGYREYDLAPFFMVALPIFAAMLIGDAGYGLIFTLLGVLGYRKIVAAAGKPAAHLIVVFGVVTMTWGLLSGNVFGITPNVLTSAGGFWAPLGEAFYSVALLWNADSDTARNTIIKISFAFGSIHLILAHLRQAIGMAPHIRCLSEIGWASLLAGMLGVVWMLFFPDDVWMPTSVMAVLLIAGGSLAILFTSPSWNPLKMIGLGLANCILPMIGTFSDTMSYIRLMAVGMASYYIANAFNNLAYSIGQGSAWLVPFAALIVLFAHALNIGLGLIAIFAHGVRLNLLEFSSNAGVQWIGHPYAPFARTATEGEH